MGKPVSKMPKWTKHLQLALPGHFLRQETMDVVETAVSVAEKSGAEFKQHNGWGGKIIRALPDAPQLKTHVDSCSSQLLLKPNPSDMPLKPHRLHTGPSRTWAIQKKDSHSLNLSIGRKGGDGEQTFSLDHGRAFNPQGAPIGQLSISPGQSLLSQPSERPCGMCTSWKTCSSLCPCYIWVVESGSIRN